MSQEHFRLGYIPGLNGLRGAAILSVMFFHAGAPFLQGGFIGVDLFFVLSGFLITTLLIQEFDGTGSVRLRDFYMRRVLRLGPALIAFLVVFCCFSFFFSSREEALKNYIDAAISLFYLSNWARAFSIHAPDLLGHTWSLSIEEQFYLLWPIILLTLLRFTKNRYSAAIAAFFLALISWMFRIYLALHNASPDRLFNGLDTRAESLMIGCTLGILLASGLIAEKVLSRLRMLLLVAAPLSAAGLLAFSVYGYDSWLDVRMDYFGFIVIELMAAALIFDILLNPRSIMKKLLSARWLVWVGSISYGLYLWHYPIYRTMAALGFTFLIGITLGSIATFLMAVLSYYLLEQPLLRLKKRFTPLFLEQ